MSMNDSKLVVKLPQTFPAHQVYCGIKTRKTFVFVSKHPVMEYVELEFLLD